MNFLQNKASNPEISTWVSASAGTGKTKILIDRILRLLLKGESFNKILCLTFTNAAAGEMKERISLALANWSNLSDEALSHELYKTIGKAATSEEISTAKRLYDFYLKSEETINIHTIHSFCQKLLKKFPLEAGVTPNFKIIEEIKGDYILSQIKKSLMTLDELEPISEYLTINFHELIIDEIISEIIDHRQDFLKFPNSLADLKNESIKLINEQKNIDLLINNHYEQIKQNQIIKNYVGFGCTNGELKKFFLTDSNQKKKRIVTQKIAKPGSSLYLDLELLQEQVYAIDQKEKTLKLENHSQIISLLGAKIILEYELYKVKNALLDYDDLIIYTCRLLNDSTAKEWVLYKLDGGIDHLLVDEAQDTSHSQWLIIEALIAEFHSGYGPEKTNRTLFVVGDEKQSIFSFQGADIDSFSAMNVLLKERMSQGGKDFENVSLEISYRSAKEILEVVFHVFKKIRMKIPGMFSQTLNELQAFKSQMRGSVELWPICSTTESNDEFWPIANLNSDSISSKTQLAKKISNYIKQELSSGRILAATNKVIAPNDFMILFRKRDEFTKEVITALQDNGIAASGLDRIVLRENLAIGDLLSLGKFVLDSNDDLNIASLLKSPLVGIGESFLYEIATDRGENSIWNYISLKQESSKEYKDLFDKLNIFIEIYKQTDIETFFQYVVDIAGFREKLVNACGSGSNDAIDELLYACTNFASLQNTSLQSFIFWLEGSDTSIKRDASSSEKVKIMTLHASKGLQAPIVILCDTTSTPTNHNYFILNEDGKCLTSKSASEAPNYYIDLKKAAQDKAHGEYLRLLYVGMTRAENHLIICGYEGFRSLPENCWYELVRGAMSEISIKGDDGKLIYGNNNYDCPPKDNVASAAPNIEYFSPIAANIKPAKNIIPPETKQVDKNILSPLFATNRAQYGIIFHKILEDAVVAKSLSGINTHPLIETLDLPFQKRINKSINLIINNKEFNELIKNNTLTEVSIGTTQDERFKLGRIDLIVQREKEIIIIDYKSDVNPPKDVTQISDKYIDQLRFYKNIMEKIYSTKKIYTKILWLENGKLMTID